MPNKTPQPSPNQDPFAVPVGAESAPLPDVAEIFGDATPEQLDHSGPGLLQRIRDRFDQQPTGDTVAAGDVFDVHPSHDIWDDGIAALEQEQPGLLERVRSHRKVVAAVTALALLGGGGGVAAEKVLFDEKAPTVQGQVQPEQGQQAEPPSDVTYDERKGGDIEEKESKLQVLDAPIRPQDVIDREQRGEMFPGDIKEGEIPESIKQYNPEFFGAVRTEHGLSFNIYGATQPGQEKALENEYTINPETIEFMLDEIIKNIPNAPNNPAKENIMNNLAKFQSGQQERIIDMVIDVSETGGCLDAEEQLVTWAQEVCKAGGVAFQGAQSVDRVPIVVSSGYEQRAAIVTSEQAHLVDEIPTEEEIEKLRQQAVRQQKELDSNPKPSLTMREAIALHEMGHAVSNHREGELVNHYQEGDHDHETIDWLLGANLGSYDLQGASGESPMLGQKISQMIKSGELKPIVEKVS